MIASRMVRAHAGLFASLAATAAVIAGLGVGVPGYLATATTVQTRSGLEELHGPAAGYRVGTDLAGDTDADAEAQDAGIRRVIARAAGGAPVTITRTLGTDSPVPIRVGGVRHGGALTTDPGLRSAARLTAGTWPASSDQVAVQADAASALGLAPGGELTIGARTPVTVRVAGLWRARDAEAPRWLGDRTVRTGIGDAGRGPILVDGSLWSRIGVTPNARWTTLPVIDRTKPGDLAALGAFESRLSDELQSSPLGRHGTIDEGGISSAARTIASRVTAVLGTAPVVAIVLAALAALALVELGRLLLASRESETLLLRARGASVRRITLTSALEAGVVALLASVVTAAAVTVVIDASGPIALPLLLPAGVAVGTAIVTAIVFAVATSRRARTALTRERAVESGRTRRLGSTALVVLAVAAAVLSSIQFLRDGGPIVRDIIGNALIDPLAAPAPALAVVAVALLALVLAPPLAALLSARTARWSGLAPLSTRRLQRGLPSVAAAIVLVTLTCALLVVAAADSATLVHTAVTTRARSLGAEVVASDASAEDLRTAAARIHAPSAAAVVRSLGIGPQPTTAVAMPASALGSVASDVDGALDPRALAGDIATTRPGVPLPSGAGKLSATVVAKPLVPTTIAARVLTADDRLLDLSSPVTSGAVSIALPSGSGMRLLALDVTIPPNPTADDGILAKTRFRIDDVRTDAGALDTGGDWTAPYLSPSVDPHYPAGRIGHQLVPTDTQPTVVRMMPVRDEPVPVVLSRGTAAAAGLRAGSKAALTEGGGSTPMVVRAVVPELPADGGALIDLAASWDAELRMTEPSTDTQLWMAGTAEDGARLRAALPSSASVEIVDDPVTLGVARSAGAALLIAAAGALIIAAIAVTAVIGADVRSRRDDVAILRALGSSPEEQSRSRSGELALVLGWGGAAGLVGGLVIAALLIPDLARSALSAGGSSDSAASAGLRIDPVVLGSGLVLLVAALAALLALTALRIRAAARTAVLSDGTT